MDYLENNYEKIKLPDFNFSIDPPSLISTQTISSNIYGGYDDYNTNAGLPTITTIITLTPNIFGANDTFMVISNGLRFVSQSESIKSTFYVKF